MTKFQPNTSVTKQNVSATDNFPRIELSKSNQIPSKFIPYPKGSKIFYRPYSFGEVKQVSQSKLSTKEKFMRILSGIECEGFDHMDLTVSDFLFLGLLRKISTFGGSKFVLNHQCKKCGTKGTKIMELTDLNTYDLEVEDLPIGAELSNGEFEFEPLRMGSYLESEKEDKGTDVISLLARCCTNLEYEEAYDKLFNNTNPEDGEVLSEIDDMLDHGLKPIKIVCSKCKNVHEYQIERSGEERLLTPFRKGKSTARSRIRFGNKGTDKRS